MVFVHGDIAPSVEEWDACTAAFHAHPDLQRVCILVYTEGAAPNAKQRAQLNEALQNAKPRIAILTPSSFARAAATALSWFNPRMRVFEPAAIESAFDHLDANADERFQLRVLLRELQYELRRASSAPPGVTKASG